LGEDEEARRSVRQLVRLAPDLQAEALVRLLGETNGNRTIEALRSAGWPG
jgi:hypothetical protein